MPDINTVFGTEVKVAVYPRDNQVSYQGFAGAHGMTGLMHGSRGYTVLVTGTLRTQTGLSYNAARANLIQRMENLESWLYVGDQAWTYRSETYLYMRLEKLTMLPVADGKVIRYTAGGQAAARFVALLRSLL